VELIPGSLVAESEVLAGELVDCAAEEEEAGVGLETNKGFFLTAAFLGCGRLIR